MKKFKLMNNQIHWADIEADSLEEAQAIVLDGEGLRVEEIKE